MLAALAVVACGSSCTMTRYVLQAGCGQLEIATAARPLPEAAQDDRTPPRVRELLGHVAPVKRFGKSHGLTPTASYEEYADLDRPAAVWVVSAAEALRLVPWTVTFPIAGNVPYLGWFARGDALEFAEDLEAGGWDVDMRPAAAYSTLGWFDDPVLSTMIGDGADALGDLANTILHESVHATVYVADQSVFNESVASFVGDRLTVEYLDRALGPASPEKEAWTEGERRAAERRVAMRRAYLELERLYASSLPREQKLARKASLLSALRAETGFWRPINNATMVQFRTYHAGGEPLSDLLRACGSVSKLVDAVRTLEATDFTKPQQEDLASVLVRLAARRCTNAKK